MPRHGSMRIVADSVLAIVYRARTPRFLLLKRTSGRGGFWQSVSGHVKPGESPEAAAARETEEETGLAVRRVSPIDFVNAYYNDGAVRLEPCFGVEVQGARPRLSKEHSEYRWVTRDRAVRLLRWPGNRAALAILAGEIRLHGMTET